MHRADSCFLKFRPSILAAAACYTVLQGIKLPVDVLEVATPMLAKFSGSDLQEVSHAPIPPSWTISSQADSDLRVACQSRGFR